MFSFLAINSLVLHLLVPLAIGAPAHINDILARDNIPGPPPDPPKPAGDGQGQWHAEWFCGPNDLVVHTELLGGLAIFIGEEHWYQAARNMAHYLGNTGWDLTENLANMMKDTPEFQTAVLDLAHQWANQTADKLKSDGTETFVSPWTVWHASDPQGKQYNLDWYYAMGDYSYAVSGVVTRKGGQLSLQWQGHIFDRYNWDHSGKTQCFVKGKVCISHEDIGHLHVCGWAQEYTNRGTSTVQTVANYDPMATSLPPPDLSGYGNWLEETPWVDVALIDSQISIDTLGVLK